MDLLIAAFNRNMGIIYILRHTIIKYSTKNGFPSQISEKHRVYKKNDLLRLSKVI